MQVTVYGKPVSKGNIVQYKGGGMHDRNDKKLKAWDRDIRARFAIRTKAENLVEPYFKDGPVSIYLQFNLLKPKSAKRDHPYVRPDIDKLSRAVLDALSGVVYADDKQVVKLTASKHYVKHPADEGVRIIYNKYYNDMFNESF